MNDFMTRRRRKKEVEYNQFLEYEIRLDYISKAGTDQLFFAAFTMMWNLLH